MALYWIIEGGYSAMLNSLFWSPLWRKVATLSLALVCPRPLTKASDQLT